MTNFFPLEMAISKLNMMGSKIIYVNSFIVDLAVTNKRAKREI